MDKLGDEPSMKALETATQLGLSPAFFDAGGVGWNLDPLAIDGKGRGDIAPQGDMDGKHDEQNKAE